MHRKTTGELVQGKSTFRTGLAMLVQVLSPSFEFYYKRYFVHCC